MINMNSPLGFGLKLFVSLAIVFCAHISILYYLNFPLYENKIILSYVLNFILGITIYILLYKLRIKYLDILGFIYMGGSLLKFAVFFIFFNSTYKEDGNVNSLEAASFLIPYCICLFFETFYLIKLLNTKV